MLLRCNNTGCQRLVALARLTRVGPGRSALIHLDGLSGKSFVFDPTNLKVVDAPGGLAEYRTIKDQSDPQALRAV